MNQRNYIEEVFKRFNMEVCKPLRTAFNVKSKLLGLSNEEFGNVQRKMKCHGRIFHVCNGGYEG